MKFTKQNNPAKKRAIEKRKQAKLKKLPYLVVVQTGDWDVVEKKRFAKFEDAKAYADTYTNNKSLFAYIRF